MYGVCSGHDVCPGHDICPIGMTYVIYTAYVKDRACVLVERTCTGRVSLNVRDAVIISKTRENFIFVVYNLQGTACFGKIFQKKLMSESIAYVYN